MRHHPRERADGHAIFDLVGGAYTVVPLDAGTHKLKLSSGTGACPISSSISTSTPDSRST